VPAAQIVPPVLLPEDLASRTEVAAEFLEEFGVEADS